VNLGWYVRRLGRMSPGEMALRGRDALVKQWWRRRFGKAAREPVVLPVVFEGGTLLAVNVPGPARERLFTAAEEVLAGRWPIFAHERRDFAPCPDWFLDAATGRRAPSREYAFSIPHRDVEAVGDPKYVWEPSRHHHLTVLAAAFFLSGDERYAARIEDHLESWWRENPFLTGFHWTSGIEVGMRLLAWTWIRRLLHEWRDVARVFDDNPDFARQLRHHQEYLATLPSHGSSANNHLLAEMAGLFVSCCAFSGEPRVARWREQARRALDRELPRQTFPDGLNRELATDYHGYVLELALDAALAGEATGHPLGVSTWEVIRGMTDALASILDARGRPPRQGDGDDARGLLLDHPESDRWKGLLATGRILFEACDWWPALDGVDVRTCFWTRLGSPPELPGDRPSHRRALFPDAGLAILRTQDGDPDEIWCRCDHGPLGYLSTAAHGHADALSIEVRAGGVDILSDPGTYGYHREPDWRRYFRSTRGHNTLEIAGVDDSVSGGPFLWTRHAGSRLREASGLRDGSRAVWEAEHDGYLRLDSPALVRRTVELYRKERILLVRDRVTSDGVHQGRLSFHLGPDVRSELDGHTAVLRWTDPRDETRKASFELAPQLEWRLARGRIDPPLGWYSPSFDVRVPSPTLVGTGSVAGGEELVCRLHFNGSERERTTSTNTRARAISG